VDYQPAQLKINTFPDTIGYVGKAQKLKELEFFRTIKKPSDSLLQAQMRYTLFPIM